MTVDRWEESYEGQLRQVVGSRQLILPAARAVILDELGRAMFVRRSDDGTWVLPAGALELDESVVDCLHREVEEETGLVVEAATLFAVYSSPDYVFTTHYGNRVQMLAHVFRVDRWSGQLRKQSEETTDARFMSLDEATPTTDLYRQTLADLQAFSGNVICR